VSRLFSLAAAAAVACLAVAAAGTTVAKADDASIAVGNLYFCDVSFQEGICETSITAGDTVTWNNVAGFHTVTECDDAFANCPPGGGFDSGPLQSGNSFSHTFTSPGSFEYYCAFHPTDMRGRILVQPADTPTPTPVPTALPSGTPGTTASPAVTGTPAAVPRAGGMPADDGQSATTSGLLIAGVVLLSLTGLVIRSLGGSRGPG
jgi:plastocyanin